MENEAIAARFIKFADLMEIRGDDPFRIRSYRNAADVIAEWPTPLGDIAAKEGAKGLQAIPGVGRAISGKIIELLASGTFDAWDKLVATTPPTVLYLLDVDGIGMKTASTLHRQFKISSLEDLRRFVAGGGLEMVDGVGEKSAARIRKYLATAGSSESPSG